ncbi:hypothetical protein ACFWY9_30520 [Amycolatopsis sp. NPDC059027]|uniref:hypothetical protein n=1 Tax=Amycolatopsis sp. NPDC059027 TaxID=3346709 RepID=UPI003670A92F
MPDLVPNARLVSAREATPSRLYPGMSMGRTELASLVVKWIGEHEEKQRPHPFDAVHLGKIERGEVRCPRDPVRAALCAVLNADEHDLGFVKNPEEERIRQAASGLIATDLTAVHAVRGVVASLRRLEDATSAGEVLPTVKAQAELVDRLAHNAHGDVRTVAVGLLSEIEQYLGWLEVALGNMRKSDSRFDRAISLAVEADDPNRLSLGLSFKGYISLLSKRFNGAASLTEASLRESRAHPIIPVYDRYQRAQIYAGNGEAYQAQKELAKADKDAERTSEIERPDYVYWYTNGLWGLERGRTLWLLGQQDRARLEIAEGLKLMPESQRTAQWADNWVRVALDEPISREPNER